MLKTTVYSVGNTLLESCYFYPEDGIDGYYRLTINTVVYDLPSWFCFYDIDHLKTLSESELINTIIHELKQCMQKRILDAQATLTKFNEKHLTMFQNI